MRPRLLTLALSLLLASPVFGQDARLDSLTPFIEKTMDALPAPQGMAVGVVIGDEVAYLHGFGQRDAAGSPVTPQTVFYIASSTKSFTALMAALMAHDHHLNLDAPLSLYLPDVPLNAPLSADSVTVRDLLTHQVGFDNEPITIRTAYTGQHSPDVLKRLLEESTPNEAGKAFRYSNLGYVMTSLIIDEMVEDGWKEELRRRVLDPLAMHRTTPYASTAATWDDVAEPLVWLGDVKAPPFAKDDNSMHAAGGLMASAADLVKWLEVQLNEGQFDGQQVFPASVIAETHRQQASIDEDFYRFHRYGYGLGWYLTDYEGDALLHHFGSFTGFRSHVSFMPEHHIGVVVLINDSAPPSFYVPDLVATYIYDTMLGKPDLEAKYIEETERVAARAQQFAEMVAQDLEKRAGRPQQPGRPLDAYAGVYESLLYGTMVVEIKDEHLHASVGNMTTRMEPFDGEDALRVEFILGQGQVVQFLVPDGEQRASRLHFANAEWHRVD